VAIDTGDLLLRLRQCGCDRALAHAKLAFEETRLKLAQAYQIAGEVQKAGVHLQLLAHSTKPSIALAAKKIIDQN